MNDKLDTCPVRMAERVFEGTVVPPPTEAKAFGLRPYQEAAIGKLRDAFAAGKKRLVLQLPTGGGKTEIAMAMARGAMDQGRKVLFTCERITLVNQAAKRFSDAGFRVGVIQANHPGRDDEASIQVASVQTLAKRNIPADQWGLAIVDEVHVRHKSLDEYLNRMNGTPVVGLSATPWSKGLGKHYDGLVVGARTSELIALGYLVDTEVYGPAQPDMTGVKKTMTRYGTDFEEGETAKRAMKIVGDVVENWLRYGKDKQTAMFAVNIAHSKALVEAFKAAGIPAVHIDAYTDGEERQEAFEGFRNGNYRIISSVDVLGRGWDEPNVGCLIDARPTHSLIRHIQVLGRALRPAPGKEVAIIIDCAGNSARHGFVTDPLPEELDDGTRTENEKKKRDVPLPKPCPKCHYMKPAGVHECAKCGFKPERQNKIIHEEGELSRISKNKVAATMEEKRRTYGELLGYAREKRYKDGWAAHKYRSLLGGFPRGLGVVPPATPSQGMRYWIHAEMMKWFKGKKRRGHGKS